MPQYRAPAGNRDVLAVPPRDEWPALVAANRRQLDAADVRIGGLPLQELRAIARREIFAATAEDSGIDPGPGPLVLTGHQPELFHPGVWVKNFAVGGLAGRVGGTALNLIVDNDTLKSAALRFPVWHDRDPASVRLPAVPFDTFDAETPYESRRVEDPDLFRTFADRAAPLWQNWGYEPLLPRVWAEVAGHPGVSIGEKFTAARRCWEGKWGVRNLELPVSRLAGTAAFRRFAGHLFADRDRFREVYNAAVAAYRTAHGIRSRSHPVPDLAPGEVPFWEGSTRESGDARGRRRAATSPDDCRPRALTLTLFARLIVGDFFVHGIGGGRYDEVTDAIIRGYFGIDPPAFAVLSATLHLPVPAFPHSAADARTVARLARDLHWNPQRHAPELPAGREVRAGGHAADTEELKRLRAAKAALIAAEPAEKLARRRWFAELREVTDRLRPFVAGDVSATATRLEVARRDADANAVLRRRDFSWVLYPEEVLRPFLQAFLT